MTRKDEHLKRQKFNAKISKTLDVRYMIERRTGYDTLVITRSGSPLMEAPLNFKSKSDINYEAHILIEGFLNRQLKILDVSKIQDIENKATATKGTNEFGDTIYES